MLVISLRMMYQQINGHGNAILLWKNATMKFPAVRITRISQSQSITSNTISQSSHVTTNVDQTTHDQHDEGTRRLSNMEEEKGRNPKRQNETNIQSNDAISSVDEVSWVATGPSMLHYDRPDPYPWEAFAYDDPPAEDVTEPAETALQKVTMRKLKTFILLAEED